MIHIVNGTDRSWVKHRYVLWFGAYRDTQLMVWGNSLDTALDIAVDWIVDNAPGLLCDDQVQEAYLEAIAEGETEEDAQATAMVDTTCAGNCGNYLHSWEWGVVVEDPTREQIKSLMAA